VISGIVTFDNTDLIRRFLTCLPSVIYNLRNIELMNFAGEQTDSHLSIFLIECDCSNVAVKSARSNRVDINCADVIVAEVPDLNFGILSSSVEARSEKTTICCQLQ
jgi:hypothetical protein